MRTTPHLLAASLLSTTFACTTALPPRTGEPGKITIEVKSAPGQPIVCKLDKPDETIGPGEQVTWSVHPRDTQVDGFMVFWLKEGRPFATVEQKVDGEPTWRSGPIAEKKLGVFPYGLLLRLGDARFCLVDPRIKIELQTPTNP